MAIRFTNEHTSWAASSPITWKIEIHDSAHGGGNTDFEVAAGAEIQYRATGDNIFAPIIGSTLAFDMQIENSTHQALITDMAGAAEGRFTIVVYKDSVFYWAGVVNSPEISIEDWDFPYSFRLTAVDGLALLKNYEYRQDGTSATKYDLRYTGIDNITDIFLRCLKKLPHVVTHFGSSTKFLVTAINWYNDLQTASPVASTYDPFYYTEIDNRFAVTGQSSGNAKFLSCYDVLSQLLTTFNARLALFDGYFLAEQIEHRAYTIGSNDNYSRYYAYDGTGPTANTLTADQDVGGSQTINKMRGGSYSFHYAARNCRVKQNINSLANLLAGAYFDSGAVETVTVEDVFGNGNSTYLRFSGNLEWTFENLGVASPGTTPFIARFRIVIKLGSKWAERTVTYDTGGNYTLGQLTWQGLLSYIEVPVKLTIPGINDTWTGQTQIDIMFPTDAAFTAGDLVTSIEFIEVNYYSLGVEVLLDPSDYALDWTLRDPYATVMLNPKAVKTAGLTPGAVNPKSATYEVIGNTSNSETVELETLIGDRIGTVLNQWGGLMFDNAGTYTYTDAWGARNGTRDRTIAQLLGKRVMDFLYYPKRIYRGTVVGSPISIQVPITDQTTTETYLLQSGTYSTHLDELAGEWIDITYIAPELTYAPVEYDTEGYDKTTAGGGGSGGSGPVDNGGNGSGGATGGNGIYGGSGTVADGTVATLADDFEFSGGDTSSLTITTGTTTGGQIFSDFNGASIIYRDSGGSNFVTASSGGIGITISGSAGDKLLVTGLTDIEHSSTDPALTVLNTTSATNAAQSVLLLQANSSGTADAGFGPAILMQAESSSTNDQDAARIQSVWSTATHASRTADLVFLLTYNAAALAEHFRIVGASTPVVKIGGGTTTFGNAGITTGASFVVGGSSNTLTLGNSSGTTRLGNSSGSVEISRNTSVTNTGVPIYIDANTTGTPANGLGPLLALRGETSTSTSQNMAYIQAAWTDVTHASRTSDILFSVVRNATLAEKAKFVSSGDFGLKKNDVGTTQDTISITAYGSESNLGFAIIPKGTGAVTIQIPDGTSTGGNARGSRAIDFQTDRNAATQVASGTSSFVGGGRRNTASATYSATLGGSGCVASGNGSVCLGGDGSFGVGNSATGTNCFAFGVGADATANSSIAFLADASATQTFAVHRNATHRGEFAMLSHSFLQLSEATVGTAAQELFLDGNGGTLRATISSGRYWCGQVWVSATVALVGNGTGGLAVGDTYVAQYGFGIKNVGGTTALVGTVQTIMAAQSDATMAGASFTIAGDNTNDALTVTYNPGPNEGTTTQTNVYASIQYLEY